MKQKTNNDIREFSLLAPHREAPSFRLGECAVNDLSVDFLAEKITGNNTEKTTVMKILADMPVSAEAVSYRKNIYAELRDDSELCEKLYEVFDAMRFYINDRPMQIGGASTIWEFLTRLRSLESYINSVLKIKELISGRTFRSEGLRRFAEYVSSIYTDSGFDELSQDISGIAEEFETVRSMTIGVNFNQDFYPEEVGIVSLNRFYFGEQSVLKRFIQFQRKNQVTDKDLSPFTMEIPHDSLNRAARKVGRPTPNGAAKDSPLMHNLTTIIERMLPASVSKLKRILNRYVDVSGTALAELADEFLFYLRFIELEKKLNAAGLPTCMGEASEKDTDFHDLYNVKLAICRTLGTVSEDIVCNDISFTYDKTVQILTGPNRGGKTILTQGIGLAFLMYQCGVFVPAASASVELCTGIYTHFPVEEERTVSLGRLGEEAARFCEISRNADRGSLVLLNESFATTSHTESLYIAEDAIRYLCCLGARTVFNTHMHELAAEADTFGSTEKAVCKAVSMVMENDNGRRSYKVSYKKPDGKSYAREIACSFGITFDQLMDNLSAKEDSHVTSGNDIQNDVQAQR